MKSGPGVTRYRRPGRSLVPSVIGDFYKQQVCRIFKSLVTQRRRWILVYHLPLAFTPPSLGSFFLKLSEAGTQWRYCAIIIEQCGTTTSIPRNGNFLMVDAETCELRLSLLLSPKSVFDKLRVHRLSYQITNGGMAGSKCSLLALVRDLAYAQLFSRDLSAQNRSTP